MKKILLTGIVILLAVLFVTCDEFFPEETSKKVEYTNVVYSEDGSKVTLYLNGVGVPKTQAQRAMSPGLSKMAYDYLEVLFIRDTVIARAQWELGQSPGISGVPRGTGAGYTYTATGAGTAAAPLALMAVGTKDNKTLLGVGSIIDVNGTGSNAAITIGTDFVVFGLYSVATGLQVGPTGSLVPEEAVFDSLSFTTTTIKSNGTLSPLGDSNYPMYSLPTTSTTEKATYKFGSTQSAGTTLIYGSLKLARAAAASPGDPDPRADVERRIPRYYNSGRYLIPKGSINTKTTITVDAVTVSQVDFTFNISGSGIFSFYVDVPVYLSDDRVGTNGGQLKPITWHLRSGFGSELYSLDDGISSGGCVLMGIGVGSLDWLEIQWKWLD